MASSRTAEVTSVALGAIAAVATVALLSHAAAPPPQPAPAKTVADSSVSYSSKISPEHCDEHGRVYGGELLKLIDVAAGLVAAKHAGGPCVTISVDRVIFLQEIKVSDVVHFSVSVNRAWGSSMEIGVRVMRETAESSTQVYCCHAYLTFVAKATLSPSPSLLSSVAYGLHLATPPKPLRAKVPELKPLSTLEHKRFLLAGRRRAHRIHGRDASDKLLSAFRIQLLDIEKEFKAGTVVATGDQAESTIATLQQELIVEAYMRSDPDVKVEGDWVVASIEGFMEPVRLPLADILKASKQRGHGGYRRLAVRTQSMLDQDEERVDSEHPVPRGLEDHSPLALGDTIVMGLWTVRPQHCNSKSILFGGTLMRWIEEISSISARRVCYCPWSSATVDSLSFRSAVLPGDAVYIRACVTKVFDSSVEVYALAMAEDRNSPKPELRLVSEAFFSLVAIDPVSGRPRKGGLRPVRIPEGPAAAVAAGADKRKEERLQDKRVLQRIYA